jgi:hypothetical protein
MLEMVEKWIENWGKPLFIWAYLSCVPDNIYNKDKQLIGSDCKTHNILIRSDHYNNKTCYLQVLIHFIMLKN